MARLRHFNECKMVSEMPEPGEYSYRCKLCWPNSEGVIGSSDDSSEESSDSDGERSEAPDDTGTSPRGHGIASPWGEARGKKGLIPFFLQCWSVALHLECLSQGVIGSKFFLEEPWMFDPWHGAQGLGVG